MAWNSPPAGTPIRAQWTRTGVIGGREGAVLTRGYIRGGPELSRALARLSKGMRDDLLQRATQAGGEVLAVAWRDRVPVDDGNYRDAIEAVGKPGKNGATALVRLKPVMGLPNDQQPRLYAPRLEYGSAAYSEQSLRRGTSGGKRTRRAQPSLRPAFDAVKGEMLDAMTDEIRRLIAAATP
jgi:hypothetical protein